MKARDLIRCGLVGAGLLLAVVMFLPGSAMAPPAPFQTPKKPLQSNLVLIAGHVQLPGGRGLRDAKIHLYEIRDGGQRFVKETITNNEGFYSLRIEGGEKSLRLVPNYAEFSFGEHFSPREHRFAITSITRGATSARNFRYEGPLPDLMMPVYDGSMHIILHYCSGSGCCFCFVVRNSGDLASRYPFKVRVRYWDRSAGTGPRAIIKEAIKVHNHSILPGYTEGSCVYLGPGTAGDESASGQPLKSASGRYEVTSVELDIDDAVVEGIEGNNRYP